MKAQITYTVHCSHEAFQKAMEQHMKGEKFYEIKWRDTDQMDEDSGTYSSFSWPNKRHPELTKDLFFSMAFSSLHHDGDRGEFFAVVDVMTDDGKRAVTIHDAWIPAWGDEKLHTSRIYWKPEIFSEEMADRLRKISLLAGLREEVA